MSKVKVMSKEKETGIGYKSYIQVPKEISEIPEEQAIRYCRIEVDARRLSGKILTIIDASINEKIQNKAIKDLIKEEIRKYIYQYQNICYQKKQGHSVVLDN